MIGFAQNQYRDVNTVNIPADSIVSNRGYGAFEFFRIINKKPFYLARHLDRFYKTLHLMRLKIEYSRTKVESIINEIIESNGPLNFYIKLFAYPRNSFFETEIESDFFAIPNLAQSNSEIDFKKGARLITKEYQRFLPEAKSTNYMPMIYWQRDAIKANAVDVLYFSDNHIRETSRGNVFVVKNGKVFTPDKQVLKGITRGVVIDILKNSRTPFSEEPVKLEALQSANEVFLSSTTKLILPIIQIDSMLIGEGRVGPITGSVFEKFQELQNSWK